jgi:peptide/nickel transport system substrate-binding protein
MPGVTQTTDGIAIGDLLFVKLADMGKDLNTVGDSGFEPRLATRWHFEDSVTIVFDLDARARWEDGRPVRADDVVFSFDLFRDSLFGAPQRSSLAQIASVTARDSLTAVIRFRAAYPEEFYDATYQVRILPKHALDSIPRGRLAQHPFVRHPMGNGPYRLARWRAGEAIELAADTGFFLGRPGLSHLIWRISPDPTANAAQLVAGEADVIESLVDPTVVQRVRQTPGLAAIEYRSPVYFYVGFNLRSPGTSSVSHPLLGNRDLRRALVQAVDRESIVRSALLGLGSIPPGPISPMEWIWSDRDTRSRADTAAASAALDRLGWRERGPDGIRRQHGRRLAFTLLVPAFSRLRIQVADLIQDQLKRVGVAMDVQPLEANVWIDRIQKGRFDAIFGSWSTDPTPASVLQTWTSSGIGGYNYQHYSNPVYDRLVNQAVKTHDRATAVALWHEATDTINADAPAIWVLSPATVAGVSARFTNVSFQSDQWGMTLWRWHVPRDKMIGRDSVGALPAAAPPAPRQP